MYERLYEITSKGFLNKEVFKNTGGIRTFFLVKFSNTKKIALQDVESNWTGLYCPAGFPFT